MLAECKIENEKPILVLLFFSSIFIDGSRVFVKSTMGVIDLVNIKVDQLHPIFLAVFPYGVAFFRKPILIGIKPVVL